MGERRASSDNMMALCDECLFWDKCDFKIDTDVLLDPNRDFIGGECKMERFNALLEIICSVEADSVDELVDKVVEIYKGRSLI